MKLHHYSTLLKARRSLLKRGFDLNFTFDFPRLRTSDGKHSYNFDQLSIVEYHRFNGDDPALAKGNILIALETNDYRKGILMADYDRNPNMRLVSFIDRIPIKKRLSQGA